MRTDLGFPAPSPARDDGPLTPSLPSSAEGVCPDEAARPYVNRELSLLLFNRRVLGEAENPDNPPLERLRFLSITASNLDEFFMVRFAAIRDRVLAGDKRQDPSGLTPAEQLRRAAGDARLFMAEQGAAYRAHAAPILEGLGLAPMVPVREETARYQWARAVFKREIQPKLPPVRWGRKLPSAPQNKALHLCLLLEGRKEKAGKAERELALLPLPPAMRRAWKVPRALGGGVFLLEDIVRAFAQALCPDARVADAFPFRALRDQNFTVSPEVKEDLVGETKKSLLRRKTGEIVCLEVPAGVLEASVEALRAALRVPEAWVYRPAGPLHLAFLAKELCPASAPAEMKYPTRYGRVPRDLMGGAAVMDVLARRDIFLHHPYDSFDVVLRFIREAAADPRVLAIKQTLYRVSGDSPVVKALCDAAMRGKRVTVLLEVKARFDEENNIHWGEVLERAGCTVLYGLPRVKTHSKITLVTRREEEGLRHYVHLGTGNYNDVTAKLYTDMGLLTGDPLLGEDAQAFFNMITGFSREPRMRRLVYAPKMLREALGALIRAETEAARAGRVSGIYAKMNALVDPELIALLYEAGLAGVPVRLMVRGVCCLRAGLPGVSETIAVRSLVGRFLEHSRVFCFASGGEPRYFLSSADWMPRNLNRRVELMFPVLDPRVQARVRHVLDTQWADTAKAWAMGADGRYRRLPRGEPPFDAQEALFADSSEGDEGNEEDEGDA